MPVDEKSHLRRGSAAPIPAMPGDSPRTWLEQPRPLEPGHSHSIVDGGFEVMSSTTRLTAGTSLTMRDEIVSSTS